MMMMIITRGDNFQTFLLKEKRKKETYRRNVELGTKLNTLKKKV